MKGRREMTTGYLVHTNAFDAWMIPETGAVVPVDSSDAETWAAFLHGDTGGLDGWAGGYGWGGEPGFDPHEQGTVYAIRNDAADAAEIVDARLLSDRASFYGFAA